MPRHHPPQHDRRHADHDDFEIWARRGTLRPPRSLGHPFVRTVVKANQLIGPQSGHGVCSPLIVAEFDLGHGGREYFNDGSNLAANEPMLGQIAEHGDFGKKFHRTKSPSF
jgi:hypothetical protein